MTNRPVYEFGDVRLDLHRMTLQVRGEAVPVEPKAFDVLCFLVEHRDRLVGKDELLEAVWKDTFVTPNVLTRVVAHLRRALGDDAREARYIETVAKRGYRFVAAVTVARTDPHEAPPPAHPTADDLLAAGPPPAAPRRRGGLWLATLIVCGALALGWAARQWRPAARYPSSSTAAPVLQRVTVRSGNNASPSLSPDGRSIAYVSDKTGHFEIYVLGLAPGSRDVPITSDGGGNRQPEWSPDGRWIAYHSRRRGGIWVVPATGGTAQQIVEFGSEPSWAPDSERLVFTSSAGGISSQSRLWTVRRDGTRRAPLTEVGQPPGGHRMPSWSHDGRWIVFVVTTGKPPADLWLVAPADGSVHRVARAGAITDPRFGPDDRTVYWGGVSSEWNPEISRVGVSVDTGQATGPAETVEPLADGLVSGLSIARNGSVAISLSTRDSNIWAVDLTPAGDGREPVRLTDDVVRSSHPDYGPDGRIAYSQISASVFAWTMNADGTRREPLLSDAETASPEWSRDPSRLLVTRGFGPDARLAWVDASTRRVTPLPLEVGDMAEPRLSPDGRAVAFHVIGRDGVMNVWTAPLDGGPRRRVTRDAEAIGYPSWSPDGRWLAVEVKRGEWTQVGVVRADGGAPEQLTNAPGQSWPNDWAPDDDRIAFAGERDGVWNIWTVSRRTRETRQITHFPTVSGYVRWPTFSPRGDRLVFERSQESASIWRTTLP